MTRTLAAIAIVCGVAAGRLPAQEPPSPIAAILTPAAEAERPEPEPEEPERDEIETDRDSFTPATRTVGRGRLVVESAYSFIDNRRRPESHSFPEFLMRWGVTDRIELRLGWNYEIGGAAVSGAGGFFFEDGLERESNLNIGLKAQVSRQDRWVPQSSLILTALVPTSGPEPASLFVGTYAFGWELPNRWKLDAAMRYGTDVEDGDHFHDWAPSVVVKAPIGESWSVHAEYFGIFTGGKERDDVRHFISPGVHYLVTPDFEVGVRLGWGLNDQSARFFSNVGFGYRF